MAEDNTTWLDLTWAGLCFEGELSPDQTDLRGDLGRDLHLVAKWTRKSLASTRKSQKNIF